MGCPSFRERLGMERLASVYYGEVGLGKGWRLGNNSGERRDSEV